MYRLFLRCSKPSTLAPSHFPSYFTSYSPSIVARISCTRSNQHIQTHRSLTTSHSNYIQTRRSFTTSHSKMGKDTTLPRERPKHQMAYFPGLTSEVRAFGQFRKVMHTGLYTQLVSMEIPVGGDIGDEVHEVDQVLIFTSGEGKATIAGVDQDVKASDVVIVPAGTAHQFINTSKSKPLELVTIYGPAEHDPQTVHKTKEEGDEEEDNGIDVAPGWALQSKDQNEKDGYVKHEGGPYADGDDGRHNREI